MHITKKDYVLQISTAPDKSKPLEITATTSTSVWHSLLHLAGISSLFIKWNMYPQPQVQVYDTLYFTWQASLLCLLNEICLSLQIYDTTNISSLSWTKACWMLWSHYLFISLDKNNCEGSLISHHHCLWKDSTANACRLTTLNFTEAPFSLPLYLLNNLSNFFDRPNKAKMVDVGIPIIHIS